jgi:hypothetical protein
MEAKTALIGANGVAVLHAIAAVYPDVAFLVFPADPERDHAVRFGHALKNLQVQVDWMVLHPGDHIRRDFPNRLVKFNFTRVFFVNPLHEGF